MSSFLLLVLVAAAACAAVAYGLSRESGSQLDQWQPPVAGVAGRWSRPADPAAATSSSWRRAWPSESPALSWWENEWQPRSAAEAALAREAGWAGPESPYERPRKAPGGLYLCPICHGRYDDRANHDASMGHGRSSGGKVGHE